MFSTIFKHELNYWFKKPAFYIYLAIFAIITLFFTAASAGFFDFLTVTTGSSRIVNSPLGINGMINELLIFILFLFPSIIGVSIYRDFKSEMHTILYSYPFTKANYLFAKFLSSVIVVMSIVFTIGIFMFIGYRFPGTNSEIVGDFNILAYLYSFVIYIVPNVLFFGTIVFGVVTFSRNISAGFITIMLLFFASIFLGNLLSEEETRYLGALLDPFGGSALNYYTRYWTLAEQNEMELPFRGVIVYNRLIWLGVSTLIFGSVFRLFTFSQNAFSLNFKKNKGERSVKQNFGGIVSVKIPKVRYDFSLTRNLRVTWRLSIIDFKYIFKSLPFICILLVGLLFILGGLFTIGLMFGTPTLPLTWQMLLGGGIFGLVINICTFLYAGMLVHRASIKRTNHLIDITPIPNWVLLISKFLALIKMQIVMLFIIMISGILFQVYNGFYDFEIGHYLYELYGLDLVNYIVWAFLALFIQTILRNPYLGLFVLLVISIGMRFLDLAGIENDLYKYNEGPGFAYSDMNGYGSFFASYMAYKVYWILCGLVLLVISSLFWVRGIPNSFKERLNIAVSRFKGVTVIAFVIFLVGFFVLGNYIYSEDYSGEDRLSSKEREKKRVEWEKTYKKYENYKQPRVVAVNVNVNIFPKERNFNANGAYVLINKTDEPIDSLFLNYNDYPSTFKFDQETDLVSKDSLFNFDIYQLKSPLQPGDTLQLAFSVKNKPNTALNSNSPVLNNGTFINNFQLFPSFGYNSSRELTDDKTRKKYGLPKNDLRPHPSDSTALGNTYISKDSDWIDFEATVSTSEDQIAIAPGYLIKEWNQDGRRYFHYKMDSKILNFYAFNSARYEVKKELWNDVSLEIYYHKEHTYNLDRMMDGMKAALKYDADNFSPYQHRQARIIEFPRTRGAFAQSFPNTIPFSEGLGFIADVDDTDKGGVDYPFAITAHEIAHQWWAHQVIGADVLGATMLSESLSEYVSLKVLEHEYGKTKMRKFLKKALDGYLLQRTGERKREKPLMYNDGQGYIRYQKGSLVFYALSDYIGEKNLNNALKKYVEKVQFQEPPYTTSIDMVNYIREATPDSLQYVIKDMFETITLYRNRIVDASYKELDNGKYQVDIEFNVSKYRNNDKGRRFYGEQTGDTITYKTDKMRKPILSVKLNDYIDLGIFGEEEVDGSKKEIELYFKKIHVTEINNKIRIIVNQKPVEVGIDPYNKLIDIQSDDNRRKI